MSSRAWLNVVILIAVVVLALFAFYQPSNNSEQTLQHALTPMNKVEVSDIEIRRPGKTTVRLQKQDQHWYVREPIKVPASPYRVDTLLELLQQNSFSRYQVEPANLAKYGLQPPKAELQFNHTTLALGEVDPLRGRRYVLFADQVHLINDNYEFVVNASVKTYVDAALLPQQSAIEDLRLPDMEIRLQQGRWQISPPPAQSYSQDDIQSLIDEWRYGQALAVELLQQPRALDPTATIISVTLKDQTTPLEFELIQKPEQTVLIRPELGIRYQLAPGSANRLFAIVDTKSDLQPAADE
ncbi:DUF4340 domain-containing protein [Kaarinaea lacus]